MRIGKTGEITQTSHEWRNRYNIFTYYIFITFHVTNEHPRIIFNPTDFLTNKLLSPHLSSQNPKPPFPLSPPEAPIETLLPSFRAPRPSEFWTSREAPEAMSRSATSMRPFSAAKCRGVEPRRSELLCLALRGGGEEDDVTWFVVWRREMKRGGSKNDSFLIKNTWH